MSSRDQRAVRRARRSLARRQLDGDFAEPSAVSGTSAAAAASMAGNGDNAKAAGDEVDDDDLCPICQMLLHDPVKTGCNHTLCKFCMAAWANVSLSLAPAIVDVDEEEVVYDPVADLEARCPMCRTLTSAQRDVERANTLKAKYPTGYAEREAEAAAESRGDEAGGDSIQTLTLYIGNRHTLLPSEGDGRENNHEWTFFVKPSTSSIVEEVHIHLHPTFRVNKVLCQRPPYQITRWGWGYFTISASVILKAGYSWVSDDAQDSPDGAEKGLMSLEWTLDFEGFGGKGSMARHRLKVKNDHHWEDVSDEESEDNRHWRRTVRRYEEDARYEP